MINTLKWRLAQLRLPLRLDRSTLPTAPWQLDRWRIQRSQKVHKLLRPKLFDSSSAKPGKQNRGRSCNVKNRGSKPGLSNLWPDKKKQTKKPTFNYADSVDSFTQILCWPPTVLKGLDTLVLKADPCLILLTTANAVQARDVRHIFILLASVNLFVLSTKRPRSPAPITPNTMKRAPHSPAKSCHSANKTVFLTHFVTAS